MLEVRKNNDFTLIGLYETKEECINVMNKMINDVLVDDALIIFENDKLVFARQGKKVISKEKTGNTMKKFTSCSSQNIKRNKLKRNAR
jgi:hypothetical protein